MAHNVEPMDIDSDFDNKENSVHNSNVYPRTPCTEKGYEELDVSELNMKLRYSVTPAASPMSKSYTANCIDNKNFESGDDYMNGNLTRSFNSGLPINDNVNKSVKSLPLQPISTEQFVDKSRNTSVLRSLDSTSSVNVGDVTITISSTNENYEIPSSSSSANHTPESVTPTKELPRTDGGSPIMRGLKSVLNMFRPSQSPIPPAECEGSVVKPVLSPADIISDVDSSKQLSQAVLASTPIASQKVKESVRRSSPLKESIVFNQDLEKELMWKDETTIFFKGEKIPINKLFYPKSTGPIKCTENEKSPIEENLNTTVEYMDVSCNDSVVTDQTMTDIQSERHQIVSESDGEFVDCETTFTNDKSEVIDDNENNKIVMLDNNDEAQINQTDSFQSVMQKDKTITVNNKIISLSNTSKDNVELSVAENMPVDLLTKLENVVNGHPISINNTEDAVTPTDIYKEEEANSSQYLNEPKNPQEGIERFLDDQHTEIKTYKDCAMESLHESPIKTNQDLQDSNKNIKLHSVDIIHDTNVSENIPSFKDEINEQKQMNPIMEDQRVNIEVSNILPAYIPLPDEDNFEIEEPLKGNDAINICVVNSLKGTFDAELECIAQVDSVPIDPVTPAKDDDNRVTCTNIDTTAIGTDESESNLKDTLISTLKIENTSRKVFGVVQTVDDITQGIKTDIENIVRDAQIIVEERQKVHQVSENLLLKSNEHLDKETIILSIQNEELSNDFYSELMNTVKLINEVYNNETQNETNTTESNTNQFNTTDTNKNEMNSAETNENELKINETLENDLKSTENLELEPNEDNLNSTETNKNEPNFTEINTIELNTTETKAIVMNTTHPKDIELNTTQTKEFEFNTTHPMKIEWNITQTKDIELNTTQTKDTEMNTTQTKDTEMKSIQTKDFAFNTTQTNEIELNTTEGIEIKLNTTETMDIDLNTTQIKDIELNTTQTKDTEMNTTQTKDTEMKSTQTKDFAFNTTQTNEIELNTTEGIEIKLNTTETMDIDLNTTQIKDIELNTTPTNENKIITETHHPNKIIVDNIHQKDLQNIQTSREIINDNLQNDSNESKQDPNKSENFEDKPPTVQIATSINNIDQITSMAKTDLIPDIIPDAELCNAPNYIIVESTEDTAEIKDNVKEIVPETTKEVVLLENKGEEKDITISETPTNEVLFENKDELQINIDKEVILSESNSPFVSIDHEVDPAHAQQINLVECTPFASQSKSADSPPISPKISSKGYNFNFDEIDDPFATKTKIRLSPPPYSPEKDATERVKQIPSYQKNKNRRKSQPEPKKSISQKKASNKTFSGAVDVPNRKSLKPAVSPVCSVAHDTKNKDSINKDSININSENADNIISKIDNDLQSKTSDLCKEPTEQVENIIVSENTTILQNEVENITEVVVTEENKIAGESFTSSNEVKQTSSSEQSAYYSAETSTESTKTKNVFNIPEIDDIHFNPFITKSKVRESPPRSNDSSSDKQASESLEGKECGNISNITCSSKTSDERDITVREIEVHTEDEDTLEGPFLETEDLNIDDKISDFDGEDVDMMQFSELPTQSNEEQLEGGEMFIDAEAFEFLLNQNKSNVVADSGKESLFLKFDPLFAKRVSTDGVLAALNKVQKRQSTPKKVSVAQQLDTTFEKPVPGPSNLNSTHKLNTTELVEESSEDLNVTVSKPMMVVTPAVNPVTTRNKSLTPTSSNRRSITFTSPAIAVIDRLLSMSGNNSLLGHDNSMTQISREQNEADHALTQLRELLAEKEIQVYNLRSESKELKDRLSSLESQMRALESDGEERLKKINGLNEKLCEKTRINKSMAAVVEEYERTIASLIAESEQDKKRHNEERIKLVKERDEQTTHLASMEVSFSDLHSKYEKSKQIILACKANEDAYKKSLKEFEENLSKMQSNYELLKQHATSKLNHANQELEKINKSHESEVLKLNAMIKRKELHITSLEETLIQKTKANEELTMICDELINKVA